MPRTGRRCQNLEPATLVLYGYRLGKAIIWRTRNVPVALMRPVAPRVPSEPGALRPWLKYSLRIHGQPWRGHQSGQGVGTVTGAPAREGRYRHLRYSVHHVI